MFLYGSKLLLKTLQKHSDWKITMSQYRQSHQPSYKAHIRFDNRFKA